MATSLKIRDQDKKRLDRLQGELMARRGRRLSQQELVSWLLNLGESHKERLLDDAERPLTKRELAALDRLCVKTGVRTREEEIDRAIAAEAR